MGKTRHEKPCIREGRDHPAGRAIAFAAKRTLDSLAYGVPRFTDGMIDIAKYSTDANGPCPQGAACFRPPLNRRKLELENLEFRRNSAQPHLDSDPDQVRMVLGPEFLLEQGRGVGDGLVGNLQRIGDLDDLVAAAQQPQNFQLARRHL